MTADVSKTINYETLSPLTGICTHDLLHEARIHAYGENYHLPPHTICKPTPCGFTDARKKNILNEVKARTDSKVLCGSGRPLALDEEGIYFPVHDDKFESLLALSRAGHVPNDTPETSKFEGHVRRFATWLAERYWQDMNPSWYEGFTLLPIGSFPCNTKVSDIDEFDYLCVLKQPNKNWELREYSHGAWKARLEKGLADYKNFYRSFRDKYLKIVEEDNDVKDPLRPRIAEIYTHGPATCVEITWTCIHGHGHGFGVDISLATEYTDQGGWWSWALGHLFNNETTLTRSISNKIATLPKVYQGLIGKVRRHIFVYTKTAVFDWSLSSCSYDSPLLEVLEDSVTPYARDIFRCLKILTKFILPNTIRRANIDAGWRTGDSLTSHCLKCLMFREVVERPHRKEWNGEQAVNRIADIIETLALAPNNHMMTWPLCKDIITETGVSSTADVSFFTKPMIKNDLLALAEHVRQSDRWPSGHLCSRDDFYMRSLSGNLHKTVINKDMIFSPIVLFVYCPRSNNFLSAHPIIQWCSSYINKLWEQNKGANVNCHHLGNNVQYVWGLVYGGTLTSEDMEHGGHQIKLKMLHQLREKHRHAVHKDRVWPWYIKGCIQQIWIPLPDEMTIYFSNASASELHCILNCVMHTKSGNDMMLGVEVLQPVLNRNKGTRRSDDSPFTSAVSDKQLNELESLGSDWNCFRECLKRMKPAQEQSVTYLAVHHLITNYSKAQSQTTKLSNNNNLCA